MKLGKKSWLLILMVIVMCVSTLGGTFAWFTDEVTTTSNIVESGNLDAKMQWADGKQSPASASWKDASQGAIFEYALWEPGYTQVRHLHVKNAGNLAFKYQLSIAAGAEVSSLSDVIDVYVISPAEAISGRTDLTGLSPVGTLTDVLAGLRLTGSENFLLSGQETNLTIALKMQEEAGNEYQNLSIGSDFAVQLLATQYAYEEDSFGKDYDAEAVYGNNFKYFNASAPVPGIDSNGRLTKAVVIGSDADPMQAYVPAGVKLVPGTKVLRMTISRMEHRDYSIPMYDGQFSTSYDVHIEGIAEDNDKPITVDMGSILPEGLKDTSVQYYHVENDTPKQMKLVNKLSGNNQFTYDAATGSVTLSVCTFSEITQLVDPTDPWDGTVDTKWYNDTATEFVLTEEEQLAGLGQLVAEGKTFEGKTIKLGADMNLGANAGRVFLPIGYDESKPSNLGAFKGIFDGQNHVVRDLYQNTWNIKGNYDGNYYKLSMGLFGLIEGGTVKNLIIYRFKMEGEFAPMGCVAGRAKGGNFENIWLYECHPATYNTGVGGIIGWDYGDGQNYTYNFTNINIDPSNKIGALWGTYDAAVGGIMGYLSEDSRANFTDCSVGAVLDVYNDVCGNYQYYQYRYSGMLVGTVGEDGTPDTSKINCDNCLVHYDDWVHNYYCEFEKNSQASYTKDFQFSRIPHSEINFTDSNNNGRVDEEERETVVGCTHTHTAEENNRCIHLPFRQLLTGYGWGASPVTELPGVTIGDYAYTVTFKDGSDTVLFVDYMGTSKRQYNIWQEAREEGKTFLGWVNGGGQKVTYVGKGNGNDVTVYADWEEEYFRVARFVDLAGNVIAEIPFDIRTDKFDPDYELPKVPDSTEDDTEIVGEWEDYSEKLKGTSDFTVKPVYAYHGELRIEPVDSDGDGSTDYYQVLSVSDLKSEEINIPGKLNGLPVKNVVQLTTNMWDGARIINVKEGVEVLEKESLGRSIRLHTVNLPSTLKEIQSNALCITNLIPIKEVTINYNGTSADWEKIDKADDWYDGLLAGSKIVCEDGEYRLERNWTTKKWVWYPKK